MAREINLSDLITRFDLTGWEIMNENGNHLTIMKLHPVSDMGKLNEYLEFVPDGEVCQIECECNFYTEKGLRYLLLQNKGAKETGANNPYNLVYPYIFIDKEGKTVMMDELLNNKPINIWSL